MVSALEAKQIRYFRLAGKLISEIANELNIPYKTVKQIYFGRVRYRANLTQEEIQNMQFSFQLGERVLDISEDFCVSPTTVRKYCVLNVPKYRVQAPDGKIHEFSNISAFALANGLSRTALHRLVHQESKSTRGGWRLIGALR